ncbi:flagellar hook-length control protein FliK [Nocardioides bruguierae]|uniref:flagellar hook-length control protein FliK n=1 Tax=Nocardioides bruguierae TaxID=2945102 RepID=UPI002342DDA7|nr:flagellar hook-length control protein FliK [Nocardioides bruguierae]
MSRATIDPTAVAPLPVRPGRADLTGAGPDDAGAFGEELSRAVAEEGSPSGTGRTTGRGPRTSGRAAGEPAARGTDASTSSTSEGQPVLAAAVAASSAPAPAPDPAVAPMLSGGLPLPVGEGAAQTGDLSITDLTVRTGTDLSAAAVAGPSPLGSIVTSGEAVTTGPTGAYGQTPLGAGSGPAVAVPGTADAAVAGLRSTGSDALAAGPLTTAPGAGPEVDALPSDSSRSAGPLGGTPGSTPTGDAGAEAGAAGAAALPRPVAGHLLEDTRLPRNPLTARVDGRARLATPGSTLTSGTPLGTVLGTPLGTVPGADPGDRTDRTDRTDPGPEGLVRDLPVVAAPAAAPATSAPAAVGPQDGGAAGVQAPGAATATGSPAPAAPADAPRATPAAQLAPEVTRLAQAGPGTHRVVMRLAPEQLGQVRVTLTLSDGEVHVRLAAENAQARAALHDGSSELFRALERALPTLADARVTVQDADGSTSTSSSWQQRQDGQQAGQQDGRNGASQDLNQQGDRPMTDVSDQGRSPSDPRHDAAGHSEPAGTRAATIARDGATTGATTAPADHPSSGPLRLDVRV